MANNILMIVQSHYLNDPRVRREAESLAEAGYPVDVISLLNNRELPEQIVNGVRVYGVDLARQQGNMLRYLYEYGAFTLVAAWLALRLHLRNRYKIIQVHNLPDTLVFAALLPKFLGARVLFDAHEAMPEALRIKYGWGSTNSGTRIARMLEWLSMSLADQVLTIHEPMRQLFTRSVPAKKISVVMNWPDESIFRSDLNCQSSHNGFVLIYAGTIAEGYGLQVTIRALSLVKKEIPGLRLRILGKGDYVPALKSLSKDLGVDDAVSFESPVPLARIAEEYCQADAGLSPHEDGVFGSIYFSTKVAEYLAVGLPAIVSRTSIMTHYYDDSSVAFFTPGDPDDLARQIRTIYMEGVYRKNLIHQGLEHSRKHRWSLERENYLKLINQLIDGRE